MLRFRSSFKYPLLFGFVVIVALYKNNEPTTTQPDTIAENESSKAPQTNTLDFDNHPSNDIPLELVDNAAESSTASIDSNPNPQIVDTIALKSSQEELEIAIAELELLNSESQSVFTPEFAAILSKAKRHAYNTSNLGHPDALNELADALSHIDKDRLHKSDLFELYQAAYDNGAKNGLIPLALFYEEGKQTSKNQNKAYELIQAAYDLGQKDSAYHLARYYEAGNVVKNDYKKARSLFLSASNEGNSDALVRLGLIAREGYIDNSNPILAKSYFQEARNQGNATASYLLSKLYRAEAKLNRDRNLVKQSFSYLIEASSRGHVPASTALAKIAWNQLKKDPEMGSDRVLELLTNGAEQLNRVSIEHLTRFVEEENLDNELRLLANDFKHELLEEGNYEISRELALFELTLENSNPDEQEQLALYYLRFAEEKDWRAKQILKRYESENTPLIELLKLDSTFSYEEAINEYRHSSGKTTNTQPRPIKVQTPEYPPALGDLQASGSANVEFIIQKDGSITDARITNSTHQAFEDPAIKAIESSRFAPATDEEGNPVKTRASMLIEFRP